MKSRISKKPTAPAMSAWVSAVFPSVARSRSCLSPRTPAGEHPSCNTRAKLSSLFVMNLPVISARPPEISSLTEGADSTTPSRTIARN